MTFNEAYDNYIMYVKLKQKPQSLRVTKSRLKSYILPYIGEKDILTFSTFDYMTWQNTIEGKGFKYKYKKSLHCQVVNFLNFVIKFYNLDIKNVAHIVGNFKNNFEIESKMNYFTFEEFKKFVSVINDDVDHALFNFLFFSGCRIGEALALTFEDLEENSVYINKTISKEFYNGCRAITTPKTKKSIRHVLIDRGLQSELIKLKEHYNTKFGHFNKNFYIFGGIKPLCQTTIERHKNNYCDKANVKRIRIHDFRHSYATLLVNLKIPIEEVSQQLGHSNVTTTYNIYVHNNEENKKRLLDSLSKLRTSD